MFKTFKIIIIFLIISAIAVELFSYTDTIKTYKITDLDIDAVILKNSDAHVI